MTVVVSQGSRRDERFAPTDAGEVESVAAGGKMNIDRLRVAQIKHAHVTDINLSDFVAAELVELRIGRVVGIHAEDELVVLPFPQVIALGVGIGAIVAVDRLAFAIAFVGDHAFAELRNDSAIHHPLLLRLVVDHVHEAVVSFAGDVVRRLPEGGARARPVDAVGRRDDVCSAPMILNNRQGDELLARVPGVGMLVHRPKEGLLALRRHGLTRYDESLLFLGTRGVRRGNHVAGEDDVVVAPTGDLHQTEVGLVPVDAVGRGEIEHVRRVAVQITPTSSRCRSAPTS